jgi:soluble lytic murein transglycosylase-like protein
MEGIQKVFQRIASIEQRFSNTNGCQTSVKFADVLKQQNQQNPQVSGSDSGDVADYVRSIARQYNVDSNLALAVAKTESNLQPNAVSPAGAVGVMQLMPDTAASLGISNIYDTRENIDGGVRYLKQMLNTFNGDVVKAVAAYNAGPAAVKAYNGVPPYQETRDYVNKVLSLSR